jgi:hypothetical protein
MAIRRPRALAKTRHPGLLRLWEKAGTGLAISAALGGSPGMAYAWERIPAEHCPKLSRKFDIALHELRPDIYPGPAEHSEQAAA